MKLSSQLQAMGWSPASIATATVNGKPLAEVEAKKPSLVDGMNKTEALYAAELDWCKREGSIVSWAFGAVKLRLARKTWLTPDFFVVAANGKMRFVEIKGFMRDDAAAKFKIAREMYPWAEWIMLRRQGNAWVEVNI